MSVTSFKALSIPNKSDCIYTDEENIWKLCEYIKNTDQLRDCYVVFISNDIQATAVFQSKNGSELNDCLVVWDYHVFLIYAPENEEPMVYDFDTRLPFPCTLREFVIRSLKSESMMRSEYHRLFRVIRGEDYLKSLSSDRSRMRTADGTWIKDPPPYPCILNKDGTNNLDDLISMDKKRCQIGEVINFETFQRLFLKSLVC
ncbi:protein N-terminal glutamine amidohydrolase-like protein [Leptotrombidium deliense]|uniref:Protein N-terminal glutamine amidohydrolase n=1 Tax=Leptotrombidium deliense TaxID=299467 RepID=A0A443SBC9_9ACAR|nr:protein N-terminal glutamine amidohydrolase-like protein [Leptotrombidium deliense]